MVTRAIIKRLSEEVTELEEKLAPERASTVMVEAPSDCSPDEFEEIRLRHIELFPEDANARRYLMIRAWWNPYGDNTRGLLGGKADKMGKAWREVFREKELKAGPDGWRRYLGERALRFGIGLAKDRPDSVGERGDNDCWERNAAAYCGHAVSRHGFEASEAIETMRRAGMRIDDEFVMAGFSRAAAERVTA